MEVPLALTVVPAVGNEGDAGPADAFALSVYPNPFTRRAAVTLEQTDAAAASVVVFDVLGRRVAVLHEGRLEAGRHTFALDGVGLPSGTYLVRAVADTETLTERITVVR